MRQFRIVCLCAVSWTIFGSATFAQKGPNDSAKKPYGLEKRVPWTTSHVQGRPEPPPPYKPERLYSKLRFNMTVSLDRLPGTEQLLVGELAGKVYLLPKNRDADRAHLFLDIQDIIARINKDNPEPVELASYYATAFDPDFAKNRYCYLFYIVRNKSRMPAQIPDGTRITRVKVTEGELPVIIPESEELLITWLQGGHNGGSIRFGLDGCLYISTGDGSFAFPPDTLRSGQDLSSLCSKILRIDPRGKEHGRNYIIPADNPFLNLEGARGEIYAYGLRNPWKMSIDRKTGDLWVGDVGWELWELIYHVNKGDNFGWSIVEGSQQVHVEGKRGPTPIVPATMEIPHTDGASITGGFVYRGRNFPELEGHYVFGDWETRRIWGAKVSPDGKLGEKFELIDPTVRIVDFGESSDGELYLLDHDDGSIFTFEKNVITEDAPTFPRKLSESGLFELTAKHQVAAGVLPFEVNAEQWSDGAVAARFIAVPGSDPIRIRSKPKIVPNSQFSRAVDYPLNSVVCKTLSMNMVKGDPSSRKRIETQLLHFDGREWQGYTYEWSDDQIDATLVERTGKNRTLNIADQSAAGGQTSLTWRFSARAECIRCHNPWSEYTLAFNLAQLNRDCNFGKVTDNQIRTYKHIGLIEDITDEVDPDDPPGWKEPVKSPEELPKLTPPFDETADINARSRSYLHANCAHCHRYNGGGSSYIYLMHELSLKDTKAVGARPTQGTFGIHEAQILSPGDPYRSVMYFRLSKIGPGHMPHLGSKTVDERGLKLIHDWIRQLPVRLEDAAKLDRLIDIHEPTALAKQKKDRQRTEWVTARNIAAKSKRETPNDEDIAAARKQLAELEAKAVTTREAERKSLTQELLSTPSKAVMLVDATRQNRLPREIRQQVLDAALLATTDPAIRDLFEVFVPEEKRTKRLGDTINPAEILKLVGKLDEGKKLFHESTVVQCRNCHRITGKGTELGPDLDSIGKKYGRAKLLESILQPSLQIDPKYTMYLVETKAGQVLSGLLVKRDETEIILRDSQNKQHKVAMTEVEDVFPQTKSLMPELLVRDFTAQQVADLLEYLGTLRAEEPKKHN